MEQLSPLYIVSVFNYIASLTVLLMAIRALKRPSHRVVGRSGVMLAAMVCFASVLLNATILDRVLSTLLHYEQWSVRIFLLFVAAQSFKAIMDYDAYRSTEVRT